MLIIVLLLIGSVAIVYALVQGLLRLRRVRGIDALDTLAVLVARGLPLERGLKARSAAGRASPQYARLQRLLENGATVSYAIEASGLGVPRDAVAALRAAERAGTLAAVLPALARDAHQELDARVFGRTFPFWYLLMMVVFSLFVMGFMLVVVVPKLHAIGDDFGVPLPGYTLRLIDIAGGIAVLWPIAVPLVVLVVAGELLARWIRSAQGARWATPLAQLVRLPWQPLRLLLLPAWYQALSRQLTVMQAAIRAGHPLEAAAARAGEVDPYGRAGAAMSAWAERLEVGEAPLPAARAVGLPVPLVRLLAQVEQGGDLATGLAWLQRYFHGLAEHWRAVIVGFLSPLVVLICALIVLVCVLAMFTPLVVLLEATVESISW